MLTSLEMIDSPRLAREEWRGERSWILPGAAASCRLAMASPLCHFTSDGARAPPTPPTPCSPPSLVSSKLLQSAQPLIGLGQDRLGSRDGGTEVEGEAIYPRRIRRCVTEVWTVAAASKTFLKSKKHGCKAESFCQTFFYLGERGALENE
ncbi:uncharacterized protein [Thunnus thynnus]|uniref:uncharacterized protein isoform X2 n=1 Tax=Thunnus thynnus TaxID=8237 RepID=UPI003528DFEA